MTAPALVPWSNGYQYDRFKIEHALGDLWWSPEALAAGDTFPDATLVTPDGQTVTLREFANGRPLLLMSGSVTCPMATSAIGPYGELSDRFGGDLAVALIDIREAHPGARRPQPHDMQAKIANARELLHDNDLRFPVLIDDMQGTVHRAMDTFANSAYLIDGEGKVVFRSLFASDTATLVPAIEALMAGQPAPSTSSSAMVGPIAFGMGYSP